MTSSKWHKKGKEAFNPTGVPEDFMYPNLSDDHIIDFRDGWREAEKEARKEYNQKQEEEFEWSRISTGCPGNWAGQCRAVRAVCSEENCIGRYFNP